MGFAGDHFAILFLFQNIFLTIVEKHVKPIGIIETM